MNNKKIIIGAEREAMASPSLPPRPALALESILKPILILMLILFSMQGLAAQYFGQNKINAIDSDWSMIRSMHFDVYFPKGRDDFGRLVTLMAEETYYNIKEDLRFPMNFRVPLIVYGTKMEFQDTNIVYPILVEGIGGFTESLRNRVVVPFEGSYTKLEELLAHELTHAYTNAVNRSGSLLNTMRPTSFPFWFSEGLPEFLSIGGEDDYNNMFILDMVVNDRLPNLEYSEGYLAYRLGESFLSYIAENWGRDKVSEYYFALRTARSSDEATTKVFGLSLEELEKRWRYHLKRLYFAAVGHHASPAEELEQRTFSSQDGSYFNYMPRFSPDGQKFVYFSNAGARYSIWLSGIHGLYHPRKLITGERTGQMEEFHYFRANLAWFPDSRHVAFAAKTSTGDAIHILDTQREKISSTIRIPELNGIFEIDISPDGKKILIAGQQDIQSDLFIYELDTKQLSRLTNDHYWDAQPRWAPDAKSVVFASERILDTDSKRRGLFASYHTAIFRLDLETGQLWQISEEPGTCSFPMFSSDGKNILYISSVEGVSNYRILNPEEQTRADVTNVLAGIYSGDLSTDSRYLVVSNYFDGAWDIYFAYNPLDSLEYKPASPPKPFASDGRMWDETLLQQLDLYGRNPRPKVKSSQLEQSRDPRRPILEPISALDTPLPDSLTFSQEYGYDDKPTQPGPNIPKVEKYRSGFAIEHIFGGAAYSSAAGAFGYLELGLADIMGNHGIGITAGFSGKLEENNIMLSYLYLKKRSDYGIGVYNFFDEAILRYIMPDHNEYFRLTQRETGLYLLWRYPFSRFMRIEGDIMLHQRKMHFEHAPWNGSQYGDWESFAGPEYDLVAAPGISLVKDNSLFGSTGPLVGSRAIGTVRASLSHGGVDDPKKLFSLPDSSDADSPKFNLDYLTFYGDWRGYKLFNRRYGLAARVLAGISEDFDKKEDRAQYFDLWGLDGVRGQDIDISGHKKLLTSLELRFPFFEYISMAFPVPITIPNIRGALFADLGTVFNNFSELKPMQHNKLKDLKLGYGFGPRLNLGYVVLRLDLAWSSDLGRISKPQYFLSFAEDF